MATVPSSIRLSDDLKALIKDTAKAVGMKQTDTHRQAVQLGCPELVKRLRKKKC